MTSSVKKGNYYKVKTKEYFIEKGYVVEYLEKYQSIFIPKTKKVFHIKKDLFASDILAMNGEDIIFINSVLGKEHLAEHIREFQKYPFPKFVKRWIVAWTPRVKEPDIVIVE